ncbi:MAG: type IV secretion system protein [Deltaproteobacteria bacterium]|nr:type IV secretion system protein [Deltaproteobacteria bacterium]
MFKLTLTLELGIFGIRIALKKSQIQEIIGEFVSILIFAAFIFAVINNYAEWSDFVFNGLGQLGGLDVKGVSEPFELGGRLVDVILKEATGVSGITEIVLAFMLLTAGAIVLIVFLIISCFMLLLQAEFIILGNAGIILLGLGGSKIFKDYAINVMKYILSLGIKFFVLNLVVQSCINLIDNLNLEGRIASGGGGLYGTLLVAIAASLLMAFLAYALPNAVSGLLQGAQAGGGNVILGLAGGAASKGVAGVGQGVMKAAQGVAGRASAYKTAGIQGAAGLNRFRQANQNYQEAKSAASSFSNQNTLKGQLNGQRAAALEQQRMSRAAGTSSSTESSPAANSGNASWPPSSGGGQTSPATPPVSGGGGDSGGQSFSAAPSVSGGGGQKLPPARTTASPASSSAGQETGSSSKSPASSAADKLAVKGGAAEPTTAEKLASVGGAVKSSSPVAAAGDSSNSGPKSGSLQDQLENRKTA